ncbi:MAG TPA: pyruvate, phosphate dikinase [Solirubrobacteraceae bacterium]|nr:pyruvate, phosphate dikinase [Solirubrobacteraceae bacterium]
MTQWVYDFQDGSRDLRDLLGGKGAGIAEMTRILGPDAVPPGFTITTEACVAVAAADGEDPPGLAEQIAKGMARLEERAGKRFGSAEDPLLVSVRSGARESMPGMMDTVLNLGLNDVSVRGLAERTGDAQFAWDSYRRLVQMFGNVVQGIPSEVFEDAIAETKRAAGARLDSELSVDDLRHLTAIFRDRYRADTGRDFPHDPAEQLHQAIHAVFDSWWGERAMAYRRLNRIPDDWGTAVNVQRMVFGNMGRGSATGVAFSRDEVTGAPEPSGDFLVNAQGEDVVSGVRNTGELAQLGAIMPAAYERLMGILRTLEAHYRDMQDTEFTIEDGRLYMLQTRSAKRPAQAAVRFACDAVDEGLLTPEQALGTLDADALDALLHPTFDPRAEYDILARGVAASPGAAKGAVVFTAEEAVEAAERGRDVILVRPFTEADDVAGFHAARGILTSEGGKASHAALVARGMGRPAVVGADGLEIDLQDRVIRDGTTVVGEGERIAIDGTAGLVTLDDVPLVEAQIDDRFRRVLSWADDVRRLSVRANADQPEDAVRARELGASGIGLCRTEHMFMAADRTPKMRGMIMAESPEDRRAALAELRPLQQSDFEGLFDAMGANPVTIRLLDPPLHEFLPDHAQVALEVELAREGGSEALPDLERTLHKIEELHETNPMLGLRGCRLGIRYPEIYEMQVEAIMRAVRAVGERTGAPPHVEVMIPLVDYAAEFDRMRALVVRVAEAEGMRADDDYTVGAMIELPRACIVADRIAAGADFFSFGTNDLTQTVLGFSRDDAEKHFLADYMDAKLVSCSPFDTIDEGVRWLVELGVARARSAKPAMTLGVCGEHGGDPESIRFFHAAGLDYVSCSPFRVPIARIAAAQAAIEAG